MWVRLPALRAEVGGAPFRGGARSPGGLSYARVSSGGDRTGGKGEGEDKDEEF